MTTPRHPQPVVNQLCTKENPEILAILHDLRAKVREMDLKLEYLIEQNSEHFRCLLGFDISENQSGGTINDSFYSKTSK